MKKILVIDDELCIRELIRDVLEDRGCQVMEAADAAQGLSLCATGRPDLVLVDFGLPGANGAEMLRRLHQQPATCSIPAVLMSGYSTLDHSPGAAGFLAKPFSPSELMTKVAEVLQQSEPLAKTA